MPSTTQYTMTLYSAAKYVLGTGTMLVFSLAGGLWYFQRSLIYPSSLMDSRKIVDVPSQYGMNKFDDLTLTTPDGLRIRAYLILRGADASNEKTEAPTRPTLLFLHANAGNMGHRLPLAKIFHEQLKMNVLMLSYRGYGFSEGSPNEAGLRIDAQTALDHILSHPLLEKTKIIVYGQSIGGAVAIDVASRNQQRVDALIIENTFTSLPELVPSVMPIAKPFMFLLAENWPSFGLISKFRRDMPILFLSGKHDEIIPQSHMNRLYAACSSSIKHFVEFKKGTHNDTCIQPGYFEAIGAYLRDTILPQKRQGTLDPDRIANAGADEKARQMGAEAGSRIREL